MGTIGGYVAFLCKQKIISYTKLAETAGLSDSTIYAIVHDRYKVRMETLEKVAKVLEISLEELLMANYSEENSSLVAGQNIQDFCLIKGISYEELATKANVDARMVSRAARNKFSRRTPVIKQIEKAMNVPHTTFMEEQMFEYKKMRLSENLKALRIKNHMSPKQLASKAGTHYETILRAERNETIPKNKTVRKLAKALGVTVEELKFGEFVKDDILTT